MEIIKVSLDITDSWNTESFREFCITIRDKKYIGTGFEYEMWIITTNDNTNYINAISTQLNIPLDRVILCVNDTTKVGQIVLNKIDIHLDSNQSIINAVVKPSWGVLIDYKVDYSANGLLYITRFGKLTEIILRERDGEKTKPC